MAFVIVTIPETKDQAAFDEYATKVKPIIASFNGKYVAVEPDHITKAGHWNYVRTVVVAFPTLARAREWYDSPEYQAIIPIRNRAFDPNIVLVRGLEESKQAQRAAQ